MEAEFNPRIPCHHCGSFLEFSHSPGKTLEARCPHGCVLSTEDKAAIHRQIIRQYNTYFRLEHPIDAS